MISKTIATLDLLQLKVRSQSCTQNFILGNCIGTICNVDLNFADIIDSVSLKFFGFEFYYIAGHGASDEDEFIPVTIFRYTSPVNVRLLPLLSDSHHRGLVNFLKLVSSHPSGNVLRKQLVHDTLKKSFRKMGRTY